ARREHQVRRPGAEVGPHHPLAQPGEQQRAQAGVDAVGAAGVAEPAGVVGDDREPPAGAEEVLAHDAVTWLAWAAGTGVGGGIEGPVGPAAEPCVWPWNPASSTACERGPDPSVTW